jgi:hypothetical protein
MNTNFPLYENLSVDIKGKKDLSISQKEELIQHLSNMDKTGIELVYVLIQYHMMKHDDISKSPIENVYNENQDGTYNIQYNLSQFPGELKNILYKFVLLHVESIQENEQCR